MKKSRSRRVRHSFLRLLGLLTLIFLLTFFLAGGTAIFSPRTWSKAGDFLPKLDPAPPSVAQTGTTEPSAIDRIERFLFLRRAVVSRLHRDTYVPIKDIPDDMKNAIIAVEDRKFYSHWGFDPEGIARATLVNLQSGQIEEGASTITQQLVKNLFLSREQSFGRKGEEFLLALDIEANYSKDEILELYLNTIYYGSNYYGIGPASEGYFGKKPRELKLPEAAMLAGLPNAPSVYSPYADFMMAKKRQFVVLDAMVAAGYIDKPHAEDAKLTPIYLAH